MEHCAGRRALSDRHSEQRYPSVVARKWSDNELCKEIDPYGLSHQTLQRMGAILQVVLLGERTESLRESGFCTH